MNRLDKLMEVVCQMKKTNENIQPKSKPSVRDMLKITRSIKLNEEEKEVVSDRVNKATSADQNKEEEKFLNHFSDLNVTVDFIPLEVYDDIVFWGGTIDGAVQFLYKITPFEKTSGIEFNYLEDFSVDNPDNEEIIDRIESYYDSFYKYWRDNLSA